MFKYISRTVLLISLVSLFNDFSSEMLYPVIPLYLAQIGYGGLFIGVLEGLAELIAGMTKIYTGSLSDRLQRRLPFVYWGYALSVLSRPLMVLTQLVPVMLAGRSIDKIGKGIRTGARDALLADECDSANRAEIFGFHRSMDTIGAILGPLAALLYLRVYPENYQRLFLISLIPGSLALVWALLIREKRKNTVNIKGTFSLKDHFSFHQRAPKPYRIFLYFVLSFSLINSSDMFLLMRAKEVGLHETEILQLYILFNLVFALTAFPVGKLADRINRIYVLCLGLVLYSTTYLLMSFTSSVPLLVFSFCLYGLYYAFSQGLIKVLLIEKVNAHQKANAVGLYEGLNSFCLLAANAIAGFFWYAFGGDFVLIYSASGALMLSIALLLFYRKEKLLAGKIPSVEK